MELTPDEITCIESHRRFKEKEKRWIEQTVFIQEEAEKLKKEFDLAGLPFFVDGIHVNQNEMRGDLQLMPKITTHIFSISYSFTDKVWFASVENKGSYYRKNAEGLTAMEALKKVLTSKVFSPEDLEYAKNFVRWLTGNS